MKYKVIAAGLLAINVFAYSSSSVAAAGKFPDVPTWAQSSVDYLVDKGALHGKPDGTFAPSETMDRGSAAKLIASVLGLEINPNAKPSFPDAQTHWAAPYIAAVEKAGVINGDSEGNYRPTDTIDRASMATILVKAYGLEEKIIGEMPTTFPDLQDHWGEKNANILVALGISNGTDNGWNPDGAVTRAEAAQFVAQTDKGKASTTKRMYIDRNFITYNGPSLSSGISNQHGPQVVEVKEQGADGWIKIVTPNGDKWVPLQEKTKYIDKSFTTYQEASHSSKVVGNYAPQTVTIVEENGTWIRIRTAAGFQWVDLNQPNGENFLEGKSIVIDPGHGGDDPGKASGGLEEKEIVLDVSKQVRQIFEQHTPFTVLLTRETDERPGTSASDSLAKRVEFAEKSNADIYVSVHANASGVGGHGTETYYYNPNAVAAQSAAPSPEDSRVLAEKIQKRLVVALETRDRGIKDGNGLYVIRKTTMPAVLAELAFVDEENDAKKLASPYYRERAAEAIYMGILDYYEWKGNDVSAYRL